MTDIRTVMTTDPATCDAGASLVDAAKLMADRDIGDVLVVQDDRLVGIVTDRDIAVRAVAQGADPSATRLSEIANSEVASVSPDQSMEEASSIMRDRAIRRIPVVEEGRPVGILSLGDIAEARERDSVLADISAAPANN